MNSAWWADNTSNDYPDWIEVNFGGSKTINEIDVFGLQQNPSSPLEPTPAMTSSYALTNFEVQYWTDSAWATVPGGSVTGNDKVWRQFTFPALTTTKIRVWVTNVAGDNRSQVVEIEAYYRNVHWLVADQLGTPRMIFNQSGTLATTKRHDYLPFGEELYATQGLRTTALGYSGSDTVRQQFTSKERDNETGLDYFLARYYSSTQGRFTSPDPFSIILLRQNSPNDNKTHAAFMQFIGDPRRWNRFAYAVNSPLVFTDKTGLDIMIIENHATKGNPIGHTAIAITGRGIYSMGNAERGDRRDSKNNILGGGVKDYILRESARRDTTIIIIKTTPEQDAAAARSMEDQAASQPQLTRGGIVSDNCSTRVNAALDAAGGITSPVAPPAAAMPGSAGFRAAGSGLSPTFIQIPQDSNLTEADRQAIQQFEPSRNRSPVAAPGTPGGTPVVTMPAQTQPRKRPEDE